MGMTPAMTIADLDLANTGRTRPGIDKVGSNWGNRTQHVYHQSAMMCNLQKTDLGSHKDRALR